MSNTITGSFRFLFLYDVSEEIDLERLQKILGIQPRGRQPSFRQPAPEYVRFENPPVVERLESFQAASGERLDGWIKYYDYGVVSVEFELAFELTWPDLIRFSSRWLTEQEMEKRASAAVGRQLERVRQAVIKLYTGRLSEEYCIIQVNCASRPDGSPVTAVELMANYGNEISQLVRGENTELSKGERTEILQSSMSYYPTDLVVVGWTAAFVYDTREGASPTLQLLEYANSQLLEFRHYDELLTGVLTAVYRSLDKGTGFLARWRMAREAERLNTIRLDVRELAERVDNSIKFVSDMFSARLYRLAAAKVGVPDYRELVDEKLSMAGELYQFLMDGFYQARGFVLELMVIIILIIELIYLFKGKG